MTDLIICSLSLSGQCVQCPKKKRNRNCKQRDLSTWTKGSMEEIAYVKCGMMDDFLQGQSVSPYFSSLEKCMCDLHKVLWRRL